MSAKILLIDIETAPLSLASWTLWPRSPLKHETIQHDVSLLCACWKWLGARKVHSAAVLPGKPRDDRHVVLQAVQALSAADIVVTQNGDRFDLPIINARAIYHGLSPRPPLQSVDTLKIAKKHFGFTCNRLDYLARFLGVGRKLPTSFDLWLEVLAGNKKALARMVTYCKNDVSILEAVYLKLRPWSTQHPNANLWTAGGGCPICGGKQLQKRGFNHSRTVVRQRYQCVRCGGWSSGEFVARSVVR